MSDWDDELLDDDQQLIASAVRDVCSGFDDDYWARCDREERPLIVDSSPEVYRLTPHFEASPAHLLVWLEHADEDDVRERLIDAWLLKAPKRLAAQHAFD